MALKASFGSCVLQNTYHKKPDNTRCSSPELKEKSFLKPLRRTGSLLLPPERNWLNKQASGSPEFK
jgi:hypothetical protein